MIPQIIEGIIGFFLLVLRNYFERNNELKQETTAQIKDLKDAIAKGDASLINDILSR